MELREENRIKNGNDITFGKLSHVYGNLIGLHHGDNITTQVVQCLTDSQTTFDSKHRLVDKKRASVERHYVRPITCLRLNKNKDPKNIYVGYESGAVDSCSIQDIRNLWHKHDAKCPTNCVPFQPDVRLLEEARAFKRDLFGAFLYSNSVNALFKKSNAKLLVVLQAFHPDVKSDVISITRHSLPKMKDIVMTSTFESVEKMLEKNVYKKREPLLESSSRDLLGLPALQTTNFFDLIFDNGGNKRDSDARVGSGNIAQDVGDRRETAPVRKELAVDERRKGLSRYFKVCGGRVPRTVYIPLKGAGVGNVHRRHRRREKGQHPKSHKPHKTIGLNSVDELNHHKRKLFKKDLDINKYYPLNVFQPIKSVRLKLLNRRDECVRKLKNRFTLDEFKKFALKNVTSKQYSDIMVPDHGESKWNKTVGCQLSCVVCTAKNLHKTRRKPWKCLSCKTEYKAMIKVEKNTSNDLSKLHNDNVYIENDKKFWTVISSPRRYAHSPRIMWDSVKRLLQDATKFFKEPQEHAYTAKQRAELKQKVVDQLSKVKKRVGKQKDKWYMYPTDVPTIYGSSRDGLQGGKYNMFRKKIATKRVQHSCRLTMTVNPNLRSNQIGLPIAIWKDLGFPKCVVGVRYPSLGKQNMMVFEVVPMGNLEDTKLFNEDNIPVGLCTAHAPPGICRGLNLDFDGDAMSFIVVDKGSRFELVCLADPRFEGLNGGSYWLVFSRDAKLGLGMDATGEPMHERIQSHLVKMCVAGKNEEAFELFTELENIGKFFATHQFGVIDRAQIIQEIMLRASKLNRAHFTAMFTGEENLTKGLTVRQFKDHCLKTRDALLAMPKYAADDGYVFTLALNIMPDVVFHYDGTARTTDGGIVSVYGFSMHPCYGMRLNFSVYESEEERSANRNYRPLADIVKTTKVELCTDELNPVFKNIAEQCFELYEVECSEKQLELYGRLRFTSQMASMGLKTNQNYLVYFKNEDGSLDSHFFRFECSQV